MESPIMPSIQGNSLGARRQLCFQGHWGCHPYHDGHRCFLVEILSFRARKPYPSIASIMTIPSPQYCSSPGIFRDVPDVGAHLVAAGLYRCKEMENVNG